MEYYKTKMYDYNYLELVAIKYGIKCAEYAILGMNEMPIFEAILPGIIYEIETEAEKFRQDANNKKDNDK